MGTGETGARSPWVFLLFFENRLSVSSVPIEFFTNSSQYKDVLVVPLKMNQINTVYTLET